MLAENWKSDQAIIGEKIKVERKRVHMTQDQLPGYEAEAGKIECGGVYPRVNRLDRPGVFL